MNKTVTNPNDASGLPMPGLSKRATEQLKPKAFGVYAKARPSTPVEPKK